MLILTGKFGCVLLLFDSALTLHLHKGTARGIAFEVDDAVFLGSFGLVQGGHFTTTFSDWHFFWPLNVCD